MLGDPALQVGRVELAVAVVGGRCRRTPFRGGRGVVMRRRTSNLRLGECVAVVLAEQRGGHGPTQVALFVGHTAYALLAVELGAGLAAELEGGILTNITG